MTVGQTFRWSTPDGSKQGSAVVVAIRSDRQEGLPPEIEQYAASWMDAQATEGTGEGELLTFMLGTDNHVYLDGQQINLL